MQIRYILLVAFAILAFLVIFWYIGSREVEEYKTPQIKLNPLPNIEISEGKG